MTVANFTVVQAVGVAVVERPYAFKLHIAAVLSKRTRSQKCRETVGVPQNSRAADLSEQMVAAAAPQRSRQRCERRIQFVRKPWGWTHWPRWRTQPDSS